MSSPSEGSTFALTLSIPPLPTLRVSVYDGFDRLVHTARGGTPDTIQLRRGWYVVRTELGGRIEERAIRHDGPSTVVVKPPRIPTPAVIGEVAASCPYYAEPAAHFSVHETRAPLGEGPAKSRLLVFVRALDREAAACESSFGANLLLLDADGRIVASFTDQETVVDSAAGWRALSAQAAPGRYLLRARSPLRRDMAIDLYPGWASRIFVMHSRHACIEDACVLLGRVGAPFDPQDAGAQVVVMALDALGYGTERFYEPLAEIAQGRFDNPMVGLLGAHVLARRQPDLSLGEVIDRIEVLLGCRSPDIEVLLIEEARRQQRGEARRQRQSLPRFSFRAPPASVRA